MRESSGSAWLPRFFRLTLCGALLSVCEVALILSEVGSLRLALSFGVIAAVLVGIVEMAIEADRPEKMPGLRANSSMNSTDEQRRKLLQKLDDIAWDRQVSLVQWMKGLAEILIVIVLAMGSSIWAGKGGSSRSEELRAGLRTCQADLQGKGTELASCQTATQAAQAKAAGLEPKVASLEAALAECRRELKDSMGQVWGFRLSWGWVLVILVVIVVLGLLAKKHKEVVPLAGVTGLATEALKHPSELVKMNDVMYTLLLKTYVGVSIVLVVLFLLAALLELWKRKGPAAAVAAPVPTGSLSSQVVKQVFGIGMPKLPANEDYLSSLGLSVVVLLWAAVMVGYKISTPTSSPLQSPAGAHEVSPIKSATLVSLQPTQRFVDGLVRADAESDHGN